MPPTGRKCNSGQENGQKRAIIEFYLIHTENMRQKEHNLQVACVNWFRMQFPNEIIFAIPNGGARSPITGAMLKAEGVTAGVPDLMIAARRALYGGLFVEMKAGKAGKISDAQRAMHQRLADAGYLVEVCRTFDDFERVVRWYLTRIGG